MPFLPIDRFLRLGLRSNPYAHLDREALLQKIPAPGWIPEVVARAPRLMSLCDEGGAGKTCAAWFLIQAWEAKWGAARYCRLDEARPRWPKKGAQHLLVVDSVQRLSPKLKKKLPRLLASAPHMLLVGQADPTMEHPTLSPCRLPLSPPTIEEVQRNYLLLLGAVWRGTSPPEPLPKASAAALVEAASGSRFRVHHALYLAFETLADGRRQWSPPGPEELKAFALREESA